ncbi:CwfJ C-terminus 1-domain-containing protein-like protein [Choanephora cucurbitarum]|nr:CwfJ C-terminus 1-domain-containing protein-like protein [Choanephora cucurbitarum]
MPVSAPPGVDFLLTHSWPKDIDQGSQQALQLSDEKSHVAISQLAAALKPRYHFAASQAQFFEREPYQNIISGLAAQEERPAGHVTRFIGLADVLNTQKQRWFYAFNLVPLSKLEKEAFDRPENTTECPFAQLVTGQKRKLNEGEQENYFWQDPKRAKSNQPPAGYVCKRCKVEGHYIKDCPSHQGPPAGYVCKICQGTDHYVTQCPQQAKAKCKFLDACWFCLANPNLEKHLIVSIGSELYMTLAKGPVVSASNPECQVPGEGHVLIIPITHYPTFGLVPPESQKEVMTELVKYKSALRTLFQQYNQDMIVFEVSRDSQRGLTHAHLQVVPIPKSKSDQVEKVARELGVAAHIDFVDRVPNNPDIPYFKLDLPNGKSLVHVIQPRERFNLQFGRLVAATVLGSPEREDWKTCGQTEEEERENANRFKEAFKPYDFSLS